MRGRLARLETTVIKKGGAVAMKDNRIGIRTLLFIALVSAGIGLSQLRAVVAAENAGGEAATDTSRFSEEDEAHFLRRYETYAVRGAAGKLPAYYDSLAPVGGVESLSPLPRRDIPGIPAAALTLEVLIRVPQLRVGTAAHEVAAVEGGEGHCGPLVCLVEP